MHFLSFSLHVLPFQEQGVKIFILLYKEISLALGLNSLYSKRALITRGGNNIKVQSTPGAEIIPTQPHLPKRTVL